MRPFTTFIILALACALNAASAHASGLHELPADERETYLKALRARSEESHARKLLSGDQCLQHAQPYTPLFEGACGAFHVKDEGHWCDTSNSDVADFIEDYTIYDADLVAESYSAVCIADSSEGCCKPNDGAIAGVIVGVIVGVVGIITLFAFCCKCCCFRPKQILVVQQQPAVAMQQQPQVVVVPAGAR